MKPEAYRYGEVIKEQRLQLGLTQRQVAERCGITDSALAHVERELRLPSEPLAKQIARALRFPAKVRTEFENGLKAIRERQARERAKAREFKPAFGADAPTPEELANTLTNDPELHEACCFLMQAFGKRSQRRIIVSALKAWASED